MISKDQERLMDKAIALWGRASQIEMIEEECIELALAIQKLKRKRGDKEKKLENIHDEMADVYIMIHQGLKIFDRSKIEERVKFKLERLQKRINEELL